MYQWNKNIWESLRDRIDRLPQAVLIQGPQGVGKLALAEQLAARLLCEAPTETLDSCGRCDGCRWVASGNHPDLRRLEPEALAKPEVGMEQVEGEERSTRRAKPSHEIRIEQVRELSDFLYMGSTRGGRRVAIVHPAEAMNVHAANALLKGLEEPPAGAMFVLVSHHPARLLPTIRSRCVVVSVPRPDETSALAWLAAEGAAEESRRWLAFAGGSPRLAQQFSSGERGATMAAILEALARSAPGAISEATDREGVEAIAEVLQKHAIDRVVALLADRTVYGTAVPNTEARASALAWATFAREMGRARALARHPLNPRLFSAEMISKVNELY